jgi:CPA1 family monovalent cation:H+ antiporter
VGTPAVGSLIASIWWPLLVAILAVTVVRALVVWLVSLVLRPMGQALPSTWSVVLGWAGLRGAVAIAAALSVPITFAQRDGLLALTFGVVLFTLLVQGLTLRPLLVGLKLITPGTLEHAVELALGRLRTVHAALRELASLREAGAVDETLADHLSDELVAQRDEVRVQVAAAYAENPALAWEQERLARQHLGNVQREAVRDAFARGQISRTTLRDLIAQIDAHLVDLSDRASAIPPRRASGDKATP